MKTAHIPAHLVRLSCLLRAQLQAQFDSADFPVIVDFRGNVVPMERGTLSHYHDRGADKYVFTWSPQNAQSTDDEE